MALGVENLKVVVRAGMALATQAAVSFKDGFQWTDLFGFIDEAAGIPAAIKAAPTALQELKELEEGERASLYADIQAEFDIPNDEVEYEVEAAIGAILYLAALVSSIRKRKNPEEPVE